MEAVDKFLKRVEAGTKAKSKEIRLTIIEAQEIALQLSQMTVKENQLLTKIIALQDGNVSKNITVSELKEAVAEVTGTEPTLSGTLSMDGGNF